MSTTQSPIVYANGVGPDRAAVLAEELGVRTMRQMLEHYPFRYVDKSSFSTVAGLTAFSGEVQIKGQITGWETVGSGRQSRLVAYFKDSTGEIELVWFKGAKWISRSLKANVPLIVYGKVNDFKGKKSIPHPEIYAPETQQSSALEPVYSTTDKLTKKGLHSKGLGKVIYGILKTELAHIQDPLSEALRTKHGLIELPQALHWIHFPKSVEHLEAAKKRIKFDEFFFLQLTQLRNKMRQKTGIKGYAFDEVGQTFLNFYENHLPFELTGAQKRVVKEIRADVRTGAQMNRLVQGDVGSGKTMVAQLSMLIAIDNGYQACLMAPTEILAQQHGAGIAEDLKPLGLQVRLLTGSTPKKQRTTILAELKEGTVDILIGTHALIEDEVVFKSLGLVVIDEQHRFAVAQRARLWKKGNVLPHILVMTATPIPRTLAMTLYGDLDVSVIDELPKGRKPIKTVHRHESNRPLVMEFLKQEISKGRQIYYVFPLIEDSPKLALKSLMSGYEMVSDYLPTPTYTYSLLHGKMKPAEKEAEMEKFKTGKTQIMVATTVIEVGVNVPNASVMVIENTERFGLSQLHQLRGRVGRGAEQSYCILMSGSKLSEAGKTRIKTMVRTNDGFEIAKVDLDLRGPGEMDGTRQSGILDLRLSDIRKDESILIASRADAQSWLQEDELLTSEASKPIQYELSKSPNRTIWSKIS